MDWYTITFDEHGFQRDVRPPGRPAWQDAVAWDEIVRVCLEMGDFMEPDSLYVFTGERPESYMLPLPAADDLLHELIRRGLYPAELAIEAASSIGLFCFPAE